MNMKMVFYAISAYLAVIGVAEFVHASSTDSPTFDTIAGLPSVGSLLAKNGSPTTMAGIDIAGAIALVITSRMV